METCQQLKQRLAKRSQCLRDVVYKAPQTLQLTELVTLDDMGKPAAARHDLLDAMTQ